MQARTRAVVLGLLGLAATALVGARVAGSTQAGVPAIARQDDQSSLVARRQQFIKDNPDLKTPDGPPLSLASLTSNRAGGSGGRHSFHVMSPRSTLQSSPNQPITFTPAVPLRSVSAENTIKSGNPAPDTKY